jgi:cellulose synthase/poly-beta-1,6-N-acetylglucosamine synthase-like glycosyltransferase
MTRVRCQPSPRAAPANVDGVTAAMRTAISVVVPSYRRPESLEACLRALASQDERPFEVIVVTRAEDEETRALVARRRRDGEASVREEVVAVAGQVAALAVGLGAARGDVVAFTDDDAAPRADWIARLKRWFEDDDVVGVGGRDVIPDHEPNRENLTVGRVGWAGKVVGNHHLGTGPARDVDILKGANMAFRRQHLLRHGFDERLRGDGAQVHNDLKVCLSLRRAGGRLVYDPAVIVDHRPALRPSGDMRSDPEIQHRVDAVHNETLALLEYLPTHRRPVFIAWGVLIGRGSAPGVVHTAWSALRRRGGSLRGQLLPTLRGRWSGWRTYRRARLA